VIIIYYDINAAAKGKQPYGFHLYDVGLLYTSELSRDNLPTRSEARRQAGNLNSQLEYPHEIIGGEPTFEGDICRERINDGIPSINPRAQL
jgi:hypothetical protein